MNFPMEFPARIAGIGTYLPPTVRTNAWWPEETVARWVEERPARPPLPPELTPSMRRVLEAMSQQTLDPFQGSVERRVLQDDQSALDMEAEASRRALQAAGVDAREVGLLLVHSPMPEYLMSNSACALHATLGLPADCMTTQVDASGNSFLVQLALAERMIAGGAVRHALLVQSALGSRMIDPEKRESTMFGDGAAATVVSRAEQPGILARAHHTDGTYPRSLIASVPGKRWYDGGRIVLHAGDPASAQNAFLQTGDQALSVIGPALEQAGIQPGDVDFFAVHQGTPWLRTITMELAGLTRARYFDVFTKTAYLFGASIPFVLEGAQLRGGETVLVLGGGVGATITAMVMRW